ncbi:hypothetical protein D3C81_1971250 [compost metagenome]
MRHERSTGNRHAVAQQQHERTDRGSEGFGRIALQLLAGTATDTPAHVRIAVVVLLLQAVEQRARQRVVHRGVQEPIVVVPHAHATSSTR